jgi:hypothetical protein
VDDRTANVNRWAEQNDFEPMGDVGDDEVTRLTLRVLTSVVDRDVDQVLHGSWEDSDVVIFDLRRGSGPLAVRSSCALTVVPYDFPFTVLTNRRSEDGLEPLLGLPVTEPTTPGLAEGFEVRTADPVFVRALLVDDLADWLLRWIDRDPFLGFELAGPWLLAFTPLVEPDRFPELLDGLLGFRDRVPAPIFDSYPVPEPDERSAP